MTRDPVGLLREALIVGTEPPGFDLETAIDRMEDWVRGEATLAERAELLRDLDRSPALRRRFADWAEAGLIDEGHVEALLAAPPVPRPGWIARGRPIALALAALALAAVGLGVWWGSGPRPGPGIFVAAGDSPRALGYLPDGQWVQMMSGDSPAPPAPDLAAAAEARPDDLRAQLALVRDRILGGQPGQAEAPLRRAEAIAPDEPEVLIARGLWLMSDPDARAESRAADLFLRAAEAAPDNLAARLGAAIAAGRAGRTATAREQLRAVRRLSDDPRLIEEVDRLLAADR